jgi:hypothetical protein
MNVPCAEPREIEYRMRQQQPVRRDDKRVGPCSIQAARNVRRAQMLGLEDVEPARERQTFHRARYRLHAAAGRSIRPRQDERNVMPGLQQAR